MEKAILKLRGMHCANCASSIKMYLSTQEGVSRVAVSYKNKEAQVEFDSSKVNIDKLTKAVQELGFTLSSRSGLR